MTAARESRRRAWRFGRLAESLCVVSLRLRAYGILARRFDAGVGEIDIVARRGGVLAVIEVKARRGGDWDTPVTAHQRARIMRAAEAFVARNPRYGGLDMRFDLMTVRPWRLPKHMIDAWRP